MFRKVLGYLPWYKWCGCSLQFANESEYQFRVRENESGQTVFQIRQKTVCEHCESEEIETKIEDVCYYTPRPDVHERRVGVDEDDMKAYGFMSRDDMARMLIEMRVSNSLKTHGNY